MAKRTRSAPKDTRPTKKARAVTQQQLARTLRSNIELKFQDNTVGSKIVAAQTTAVVAEIFSPDAGTDANERVGRQTKCTSLEYSLQVSFAATTVGNSPIRLVIVYDRQTNAALPTITDVFTSDTISTLRNLYNSRRFKILVDQKYDGVSDNGDKSMFASGFRKFKKPLETTYNNTNGGSIADIVTGSFIAYVWQNGNIITANPIAVLSTRLRFTDG